MLSNHPDKTQDTEKSETQF